MKKNFLFYLSALLLFGSCESEHLYGPNGILEVDSCDTVNLTYTNQIQSILNDNCMDCHSTANASANIVLDNYNAAKDAFGKDKILKAINYQSGASSMPPSGKLNNCTILQIETWVKQGMKE